MNEKFQIPCPNCNQFYCLKSLSPEPKSSIPLLLKCGHTMCESCIRNIVKFGEPIECKICHREMEIKTTDIAKLLQNEIQLYKLFPVNINMLGELALEMISEKSHVEDNEDFFVDLQAIIADTGKQQGQCLECQADTLLMCQQCATVICEECFKKSHRSFTVFKNHVLKNIEFQIMPNNCDIHKDKALDYYCKDCVKYVCMDCLMVGSEKSCKSHDVVPTVEMNKTLLNDVQEISPQVDALYRRLTKTAVDIGHLLHNIDNDSGSSELKEVTATIEQHFSALHAKIQNHKEEVMNIIARLKGIEKDSLVKAKNDVTKAIVDSKQVMKSLKSALGSDKNKSVNLSIILNDAKNILARPWYLTKNESSKDTLKVTVNDDLCMLISDFIQLEGNAKALYKLRATHELDGEEIPPPPNAPVLPPVLPKDVRFAHAKDKKPASPKPTTSESFVPRPESKKALVQPVMPNAENKPLIPLREIKEGSQISARITHMVDPHHFFVQRASDEKKLIDMVKQLQENLRDIVREVTVGGMYATNLNGTWMRCRVDSIERDTNGQTYHVTCLDYGTPAVVKIEDLRESPAAFVVGASRGRYPAPLAIRCSLANCMPANDGWTASDTGLVRNMIDNELLTLHVRRSGATVDCDVMTRHGTSVAHALAFLGRAILIKPHLPYPEVATVPRPKLYLSNSLNSKSCEDVHLTHVVTPDRFYVRAAYLQDEFIKLCAELNQEYNLSDTTGCIFLPENGMVCVVHINKEDHLDHVGWARAIVKSRGAGTVTVFLPDIGNTVEVNWDRLRRIKEKFTVLRGLATECHLAGVRPRYGEWQGNSSLLLNMHKSNALKLIIDKKHNRKTLGAILFSEYGSETVCVNQEMVVNMLAEATGSIDFESMNANGKSSVNSSGTQSPLNKTYVKANSPKSPVPIAVPMPVPVVPEIDRQELNAIPNVPIRLEAKIMHYESPSLIYFSLVHQQKTFDELFEDIQKFYTKRKTQKSRKWKVSDRCCAFCKQSETWRRATILQMESNNATVFYTDFACTETVPLLRLKVLHSDFEVIGDAVVKCHLAGILPASGDQWPSLTKEFLKENLEAYSRVFITKVGHFVDKSMPVEFWVYHTVQGSALEPDKSEWRCLNKDIVKQGLAVPDPSYQIEATETGDNEDRLSFLNLRGPVSDWLLKTPLRSACVLSPVGSGAGSSAGDPEITMFVTDWLPAEPLKSKEFTAMPTYIDNDGVIYLHDVEQGEVLELIKDTLEIAFKEDDPKSQFCTWRVGEPCVARYYLDGSLYRGTIVEVNDEASTCLVQYVDYGNNELCAFTDLRKGIALHQIPIQAHKCVLSRIQPINGKWETVVLDYIHKAIVEKKCHVRVAGEPVDGITPINLKYDKLWINDHLVEFDMATFIDGSVPIVRMFTPTPPQKIESRKEKVIKKEVVECQVIEVDCESELDYIVEEESDVANSKESSKLQIDAAESSSSGTEVEKNVATPQILFYPKHKEEFECTVTITNNTNSLELSILSDEKTKALYKVLFEDVQNKGNEMPPLEGIFENQACVALYTEDEKWYRALVISHSAVKELVKVRYVDYGNIGIIALSHTRAISEDWVNLPPMSIKVNLDASDTVEVADLLQGPIHAKMVGDKDSTCIELRNSQGKLVLRKCI